MNRDTPPSVSRDERNNERGKGRIRKRRGLGNGRGGQAETKNTHAARREPSSCPDRPPHPHRDRRAGSSSASGPARPGGAHQCPDRRSGGDIGRCGKRRNSHGSRLPAGPRRRPLQEEGGCGGPGSFSSCLRRTPSGRLLRFAGEVNLDFLDEDACARACLFEHSNK